jgi:hypothetical protein
VDESSARSASRSSRRIGWASVSSPEPIERPFEGRGTHVKAPEVTPRNLNGRVKVPEMFIGEQPLIIIQPARVNWRTCANRAPCPLPRRCRRCRCRKRK